MNTNKKPTKIVHCPIQLDKATYEKFRYLSQGQDIPTTEFMKKMADVLMQLCARYDRAKFHVIFEYSLFPEPCIKITTEGQSSFRIEQVPEEVLERERKAHFDKVALDIAAQRGKEVRNLDTKKKREEK
jgi:hypothetical protein